MPEAPLSESGPDSECLSARSPSLEWFTLKANGINTRCDPRVPQSLVQSVSRAHLLRVPRDTCMRRLALAGWAYAPARRAFRKGDRRHGSPDMVTRLAAHSIVTQESLIIGPGQNRFD